MGKHIFTKLVHLRNKSYGIHKELGTIGLLTGKEPGNCFSIELRPGRAQAHSVDLFSSMFRVLPSLDKLISHEKEPPSFLIKRLEVHWQRAYN